MCKFATKTDQSFKWKWRMEMKDGKDTSGIIEYGLFHMENIVEN